MPDRAILAIMGLDMARRYRRRKQDDSAVGTILFVGILGVGVGISQRQPTLTWIFASAIVFAALVIALIIFTEKRKRERLARSGIREIDEMSGLEFEKYLQALLMQRGYRRVTLTTTYDLGVDLIAQKDGERWAIQAKRYKGAVGLDAVRQVIAAASHYKCDRSMVITNSYFTRNARTIAHSTNCVLVDRDKLIEIILRDESD